MNPEQFRSLCLSLPQATEDNPFGPDTITYKVGGKIFAFQSLDETPYTIALKNTAEKVAQLRAEFPHAVGTGPYLHKSYWNKIQPQDLPSERLESLTKESYELVRNGLTKKLRAELGL